MSWIAVNIEWVLTVCGVLTCSMIAYTLAPRRTHKLIFGEDLSMPASLLMERSWGVMIFASGLLLIYAADHAETRLPILLYSMAGKSSFILPVLSGGRRYLKRPAFLMAWADVAMVALFGWYLVT